MTKSPSRSRAPDYFFMAIVFMLVVFGFVMLASASSNLGKTLFNDSYYYLKHQMLYGLSLGTAGFAVGYFMYYERWKKFALPLLLVSIASLALVFTRLGAAVNGIGGGFSRHQHIADWRRRLRIGGQLGGAGGGVRVIAWNGWRLLRPALNELMDRSPESKLVNQIRAVAGHHSRRCRRGKMFRAQNGLAVLCGYARRSHLQMTGENSHRISHEVKDKVRAKIPSVAMCSFTLSRWGWRRNANRTEH